MTIRIIKETDPWEHFIFEDFLNESQLSILEEISDFYPVCTEENERVRIHFGELFSYSKETVQTTNNNFLRKPLSGMVKENLSQFPEFNSLLPLYVQIEYQSLGKGFTWKIHTDAISKMFSLVLYWKPEEDISCGTRLYDNDKNFVKEVTWKFNRAIGFWNRPDHWHDFYSNVNERITFNFVFANPKFAPKKPW